jgi:DNA invertase Pin-like site-specific DNA recombinase
MLFEKTLERRKIRQSSGVQLQSSKPSMNSAENDSLKAIATYGRVSTGRQEDEETIKPQLSAVRDYAEKHGCKIVSEYKDEGWSEDILARPGLDQLRADARKKLWRAVLIYDPDRLARRYFYQELVLDELRELGIETLFVTMSPVLNDEDRLMFDVRGVFAPCVIKHICGGARRRWSIVLPTDSAGEESATVFEG